MHAQPMSDMLPSDPEDDDPPPPPPPSWMVRGSASASASLSASPASPAPKRPATATATAMLQGTLQFRGVQTPEPAVVPEGGWLVCDFFCSIGGVSCAAKQLGYPVVLAIDMDEGRIGVHKVNHPSCKHVTMELGHAVTEEVVALIEEAVPASQRHRLWLHLSPPCQTQSAARMLGKANGCYYELQEDKAGGLELVRWALELVRRLRPAQWSLEEVNDKHGKVAGLLQEFKRRDRALFDYEPMDMLEFGVPQSRSRMIGGRPATMHALRLARSLRVRRHVGISEVVTPPEEAVFLRGIKNRYIKDKTKVKRCPTLPGRWTDGMVELWEPWLPAPTVCASHPHAWMNAAYDKIRVLSPAETGALMTFPPDFAWPVGRCDSLCNGDLGNAVPPLFARKVLLAASTAVA